jgi:hypothetical protein
MVVNLPRHPHHSWISEICDSSCAAPKFLFESAMPVDGLPESFLFDEVEALADDASRSARCLVVLNLESV